MLQNICIFFHSPPGAALACPAPRRQQIERDTQGCIGAAAAERKLTVALQMHMWPDGCTVSDHPVASRPSLPLGLPLSPRGAGKLCCLLAGLCLVSAKLVENYKHTQGHSGAEPASHRAHLIPPETQQLPPSARGCSVFFFFPSFIIYLNK